MQKHVNIEKIAFKVVQMNFLAMHITNQKSKSYIFTVGHLLNIKTAFVVQRHISLIIESVSNPGCILHENFAQHNNW